jgi:5-formyltetrahydrofolate cyclo-ligase
LALDRIHPSNEGINLMETWDEVRGWRRSVRADLLAKRLAVPRAERQRVRSFLHELIGEEFLELRGGVVGFYWPFRGEINLEPLVQDCLTRGAQAALPVVVQKLQPLEFWLWHPRMKLARGFWGIPVPTEPRPVRPTVLLVPLLGFDAAGYRLGNGGGYYDRTLAAMAPRPLTIGVGYEFGRLNTIYPQPHDIPLDAIVTEAGSTRLRTHGISMTKPGEKEGGFASPPCFMHELDRGVLGYMTTVEIIALLNELLDYERTGAKRPGKDCSAMLTGHVKRLGGTARVQTDTDPADIDGENHDENWLVNKVEDALLRIGDTALCHDLGILLEVHKRKARQRIDRK